MTSPPVNNFKYQTKQKRAFLHIFVNFAVMPQKPRFPAT